MNVINTAVDEYSLQAYQYDLPDDLVARYPASRRDASRMLVTPRHHPGKLAHHTFADLPELLRPDDLLVLNNTRVLPARLLGHRQGHTGRVEVLLLTPTQEDPFVWRALMRPTRRLSSGTRVVLPGCPAEIEVLSIEAGTGGLVRVHDHGLGSVATVMEQAGVLPIPPYLRRDAEPDDDTRYQTVYASQPGSHAAPTAGLHFTPEVFERLAARGIRTAELTLSVSTGTFRTVNNSDIRQHVMDAEHYRLPAEVVTAVRETKAAGGRVIAVGTTSVKTLETVAQAQGGQLHAAAEGWSRLFIHPGFRFSVVDGMLTNFHLPGSTLLMLVSAFMGHDGMRSAYNVAVQEQYRFYSYGDCMLIL